MKTITGASLPALDISIQIQITITAATLPKRKNKDQTDLTVLDPEGRMKFRNLMGQMGLGYL